jgi:hypothetical protein
MTPTPNQGSAGLATLVEVKRRDPAGPMIINFYGIEYDSLNVGRSTSPIAAAGLVGGGYASRPAAAPGHWTKAGVEKVRRSVEVTNYIIAGRPASVPRAGAAKIASTSGREARRAGCVGGSRPGSGQRVHGDSQSGDAGAGVQDRTTLAFF